MHRRKTGTIGAWLLVMVAAAVLVLSATDTVWAQGSDGGDEERASILIVVIWFVALAGSIAALVQAYLFFKSMMEADEGNERMVEIASYVRQGANAYLRQQYMVVAGFFVVIVILLSAAAFGLEVQSKFVPFAFLTGGFFSGLCGYIGMRTATAASSRTAQGCSESLNRGLQVAFRSGAVMGLVVVGFGLLDICAWYLVLDRLVYTPENMEKLFEPLFTTKPRGIGLGLAISQELVEAIGGSIEVESEGVPGKGSKFTIQIPLCARGD